MTKEVKSEVIPEQKIVAYFTHFWSIQQKIQYSLNGRIKSYFGSGIQNKSADPELHQ
jgi:hypothetical protein